MASPGSNVNYVVASSPRVLIVDDDPDLRSFLSSELRLEGYYCEVAGTGRDALVKLRQERFDLVVLDWTLPDFNGVEVCMRLRASQDDTAVMMLTAHDAVEDRVQALDAGADDYLTKPFSIAELLARVRVQLRRSQHNSSEPTMLSVGDLHLDLLRREVRRGERNIELSQREFDLLAYLMREPERVHPRKAILEGVWGKPFIGDPNLLDVYVGYLRRKIGQADKQHMIRTVRGVGFSLRDDLPESG